MDQKQRRGGTCYSSAQSLSDLNVSSSEVIYNFPDGCVSNTTILNGGAVVVWGGTFDHVMVDSGGRLTTVNKYEPWLIEELNTYLRRRCINISEEHA